MKTRNNEFYLAQQEQSRKDLRDGVYFVLAMLEMFGLLYLLAK